MKTQQNKDSLLITVLMMASLIVAMGGPVMAMLLPLDRQVFQLAMLCFPVGFVSMMMTGLLFNMVEDRESREHQEEMDAMRLRQEEEVNEELNWERLTNL